MPYYGKRGANKGGGVVGWGREGIIKHPSFNFWVEFFEEKVRRGEIKMLASFSFISVVKHCRAEAVWPD